MKKYTFLLLIILISSCKSIGEENAKVNDSYENDYTNHEQQKQYDKSQNKNYDTHKKATW